MNIRAKIRNFIRVSKAQISNKKKQDEGKICVSSREFETEYDARREFIDCKERLLLVNNWSVSRSLLNVSFGLYGSNGKAVTTNYPSGGDFIRMDFPDLFPVYWLEITDVTESDSIAQLIVEPSSDPTGKENRPALYERFPRSHYIFRVERDRNKIFAAVIGVVEKHDDSDENYHLNEDWCAFQNQKWKNITELFIGLQIDNREVH
jgi:hypothetical protein